MEKPFSIFLVHSQSTAMKTILLIAIAFLLAAGAFMNIVSSKQHVDMIIVNAHIYTVDEKNSVAEAIAIRGSKIIAVGTTQDIQNRYSSQNTVDANGKAILPGLIDSHAHILGLGKSLTELDLVGTSSAQDVARLVAEKVKHLKPGDWIRGRGWDQNDWGNGNGIKPFPTASVLDKVAPNNPVILNRVDGHAIWVNSKTMQLAGVVNDTKMVVDGGKILRNPNGKPSGIFIDNAEQIIRTVVPKYSKEEKIKMYSRAFDECVKYGLTGVHDMGIDLDDVQIYKEFGQAKKLPVRIYGLIDGTGELWNKMSRTGPYVDPLHHMFSLRAIKLYIDGALGSRGAALLTPYSDDPENSGLITMTPDSIRIVTELAIEHGFQVCVHAIGDRANRIVLDEFEKAEKRFPALSKNARLRIEHAQIISSEDIPRFKKLNILPSMQPTHATSDMYWAQARLGPERIFGAYAWRSLLDDGNIIPGGSDFPIEHPNPLLGFYAAITRQDKNGIPKNADDVIKTFQVSPDGINNPEEFEGGWYVHQRMTRNEALRSFTIWGAYAEFADHQKGSIEPGKFADLVMLSKDIMTIEPKEILTTEVEMTIVDGQQRYQRSSNANSERR